MKVIFTVSNFGKISAVYGEDYVKFSSKNGDDWKFFDRRFLNRISRKIKKHGLRIINVKGY